MADLTDTDWEVAARMYRAEVRAIAGLPSDWASVSSSLKAFYVDLVRRLAGVRSFAKQ